MKKLSRILGITTLALAGGMGLLACGSEKGGQGETTPKVQPEATAPEASDTPEKSEKPATEEAKTDEQLLAEQCVARGGGSAEDCACYTKNSTEGLGEELLAKAVKSPEKGTPEYENYFSSEEQQKMAAWLIANMDKCNKAAEAQQ